MEVCIIGSGLCGIIAAKYCLDYGLTPVILSKDPSPGGIWKGFPHRIGVWNSMRTNTGKYLTCFSDFPWSSKDLHYPLASEVSEYLSQYIAKHNLLQYFTFNSEVIELKLENEDYKVTWNHEGMTEEKIFKYVIVAAGRNSMELCNIKNSEVYQGLLVKGGEYREPSIFQGKSVVCIGRGATSNDIAYEALSTATQVTQIYKKPYIIIRKYNGYLPTDFVYAHANIFKKQFPIIGSLESNQEQTKFLLNIFGNPSKYAPEWEITEKEAESFIKLVACGEEYLQAIQEKRINLVKGDVKEFYENGVLLEDGQRVEAEAVVLGLGYSTDYSFLSESLKQTIQYRPSDSFLPCILYRGLLHPSIPRMCFLGNLVSGTPGRYELSAEICVKFLLGQLNLTEEELWQGVRDEEYIRENLREGGLVYGHYAYMQEQLRILGRTIDFDFISNELEFGNGSILPQFLYLHQPGMAELSKKIVTEIKEKYPEYSFN